MSTWEDSTTETKQIVEDNPFYCPHCGSEDCVPPSGNIHSDVLFIGEFPGDEEIASGKPFVGATGRLLKEELRKVGLSLSNYRLCNLWLHAPNKKNKECFERGVKICLEEAKGKRLVVLVGSDTVKYFTGQKVSEWNGLLIDSVLLNQTKNIMAMVQPAIAFHGGVGEVRFAVQRFKQYLDEKETEKSKDILIKIEGKTFRCSCGCNVFRHPSDNLEDSTTYKCNGCGEIYEGEK